MLPYKVAVDVQATCLILYVHVFLGSEHFLYETAIVQLHMIREGLEGIEEENQALIVPLLVRGHEELILHLLALRAHRFLQGDLSVGSAEGNIIPLELVAESMRQDCQ